MSEKDGKTEKASPKKIRDARKKGQVPKSQDLSSSISFALFGLIITWLMTYVFQNAFVLMKNTLAIDLTQLSQNGFENNLNLIGLRALLYFIVLAGPALLLAFLSGVIGNLVQVGFMFSGESIKPTFSKMNPISNIKNMFGKQAAFNLLKNLAKLGLVIYIMYSTIVAYIFPIMNLAHVGTANIILIVFEIIREVAMKLSIFLVVLGIADFAYQFYDHRKNLRMSKQEIKDEYKESEGDPQMKSERKHRHQEMLSGNIQDVQDATVVITNPTHLAVAIRYKQDEDEVPMVVVKGAELMAQQIRELAKEHDVPIIENKPVARSLYKSVEAGQPVPADMYQAIAEILALIYQLEANKKHKI